MRGCQLKGNGESYDMMHAAYVQDLSMLDCEVRDAAIDGVDLEYVSATLRGVTIASVGDDALDLMGADVHVQGSVLVGGPGNGLSAGEESRVRSTHLFVGGFEVGVFGEECIDR